MADGFRIADYDTVLSAWARPCWRKERWPNAGAAEAQLRSLTRRGLEKDIEQIHVYDCPYCDGWHVGHGRKEKD